MNAQPQFSPGLILLGRDDAGKPHASVFDIRDLEHAERAAGLMAMQVLTIAGEELTGMVAGLPRGKLYESGKAFVPFVKSQTYDRLLAVGEATGGLRTPAAVEMPPKAKNAPAGRAKGGAGMSAKPASVAAPSFDGIEVGSLVLTPDSDMDGYFAAVVTGKKEDGTFVLTFRDYPEEAPVERSIGQLGLLHPTVNAAAA